MKQSEQDLRDISGDEFVDNLNENFEFDTEEEHEEYVPMERSVQQKMYDFLSNPLVFWVAGFIDGILINLYLKYLGIL